VDNYYVYVYLDPRKPGNWAYGKYIFEYEPFYVGKGRNFRSRIHLQKVKRGKYSNLPKYHIIKKILDCGLEPVIIKYSENLNEKDSFSIENEMIVTIGRFDLKNGPLRNLSNGGEGNGNRFFTEEHRKNLGLSKKGILTENQSKHLKKIHESMKGNKRTLGFKFSQDSINKMIKSRSKPVIQMDMSGAFINEFESIKEAQEKTGVCSISKILNGRGKSAGGFLWSYKNKE